MSPLATTDDHTLTLPPDAATDDNTLSPHASILMRRELMVEDALLYLDEIRMELGDKPEKYNEFLELMKKFKAQEIDTHGVIRRVRQLFRGYNKLILGFNTFLPDGYTMTLENNDSDNEEERATEDNARTTDIVPASGAPQRSSSHPVVPVEFDDAITYVTTIKKRFVHAPETYRAFLEILHTYQKEQRSISDVLEQVSQLFADHSDLLEGFTHFLPDAVQPHAKKRLGAVISRPRRGLQWRGIVRAKIALRRLRLKAAENAYAIGGTGYSTAAREFRLRQCGIEPSAVVLGLDGALAHARMTRLEHALAAKERDLDAALAELAELRAQKSGAP